MRRTLLALSIALFSSQGAFAEDHQHASLGAHEHGVASLNLVVDGNLVSLELDSPATNLVGFLVVLLSKPQCRQRSSQKFQRHHPADLQKRFVYHPATKLATYQDNYCWRVDVAQCRQRSSQKFECHQTANLQKRFDYQMSHSHMKQRTKLWQGVKKLSA